MFNLENRWNIYTPDAKYDLNEVYIAERKKKQHRRPINYWIRTSITKIMVYILWLIKKFISLNVLTNKPNGRYSG
jgi:hypothetical protein